MTLRPQSGRPLYQQIADQLRNEIYRGELAPGAQLPSERALIEEYGASRNTIRLALGVLSNEGLIVSGQGRGSFVRRKAPLRFYASQMDSVRRRDKTVHDVFVTDMKEQGREGALHIEVGIVQPPEGICIRLALEDGEHAVVRRRVQFVDGEPSALADSYYPLAIVQGSPITKPEDIPQGANRILADLGHLQVRFHDEITVRMPTSEETDKLRLRPGMPVAELVRTGYDEHDQPVRVFMTILPGDNYTLVYDVEGH